MKKTNYWFTIEPYVYVGFGTHHVLLYNTLDSSIIESTDECVITLLKNSLQIEQCGVCLLKEEEYKKPHIFDFVNKLRENYMGDIIDISLSSNKPIQNTPYFNFVDKDLNIYKKNSFNLEGDVDKALCKIDIYVNEDTDIYALMSFLNVAPLGVEINLFGDINNINNSHYFIQFLYQITNNIYNVINYKSAPKYIKKYILYKIVIDFPLDEKSFSSVIKSHSKHILETEYIFNIKSSHEYFEVLNIIQKYDIENKYIIHPIYTGDNISFFEDYVYLDKEDILKNKLSIKDIFIHQSINIFDFGKISILPNGDVYSNINNPILGNIYKQNIDDIIRKEISDGFSWFRIRSQKPCTNCAYQWLCPSPSDYEISIGKLNLCHINQNNHE